LHICIGFGECNARSPTNAFPGPAKATLWRPGETPRLSQAVLEGDPGLSI